MIYHIFIRIALLIIIGYLILLICSALLVSTKHEYKEDSSYYRWLLYSSTRIAVHLMRISVETSGIEKLPEERFLLVSNHRSNFDPILTWYAMEKQQLAFVTKPENFKVPIWGRIIRRCCFVGIDRENARNALSTIEFASELVKNNEVSVCIYPEGTRSKNCKLLPLRAGSLKIAQKAEAPIAVMVIEGTENIHKNFPFRRSHVTIKILNVMGTDFVCNHRTTEMSRKISAMMNAGLENKE